MASLGFGTVLVHGDDKFMVVDMYPKMCAFGLVCIPPGMQPMDYGRRFWRDTSNAADLTAATTLDPTEIRSPVC